MLTLPGPPAHPLDLDPGARPQALHQLTRLLLPVADGMNLVF